MTREVDDRRDLPSGELLDHVPERKNDAVDELGFLVERKSRRLASPGGRLPYDPRRRGVWMLGKVWVIVAHCNHDPGVYRQRAPGTNVLDARTGHGRRGEGFVDCRKDSAWDGRFWFSGSVPVLVIHADAVSVLDVRAS